ncbi:RipA family octameric membrane protein [Streptomyces sp. NPDC004721]
MSNPTTGLPQRLWNGAVTSHDYSTPGGEKYQAAVLEQYKLYVEMADRVSARRSLTNTFFLTVNTAFLAGAGTIFRASLNDVPIWGLTLAALAAFVQCVIWQLLIRSYKQLNKAKYQVIGELERRLPALLYGEAEWKELGEGGSWDRYVRLTNVELAVPAVFAGLYLVAVSVAIAVR